MSRVKLEASRELLAPPEDVWALLAEPAHLADWWPGYASVRPDRRGLEAGARWQVVRSSSPGLLRSPGGEGLVVIGAVEPHHSLSWSDVQQRFSATIRIRPEDGRTRADLAVDASFWRIRAEGLRRAPQDALSRLHALCQTAASL